MHTRPGKESVVARLFGFGRKRNPEEEVAAPVEEETGFARTEEADEMLTEEEPEVTIPEQVIRVRTPGRRRKDEVITAIGDSFRELTSLLGSVSDRLDRQDARSSDLADQLKDLPEYLRALPRLHEEQTHAVQELSQRVAESADAIKRLPDVQERTAHALSERVAEGTEAIHGVTDALARIPDELRERSQAQEEAIRQVAAAQQQTAKVMYAGQQKSLQLFHQATQKTLQSVQRQRVQMEHLVDASVANMKRTFILAAAFMAAALISVAGLILFR
jgi:chromosome segregation ATPase